MSHTVLLGALRGILPGRRGGAIRLAHDYVHPLPNHGHCRIRIYEPDSGTDATVVVCTEPEDNPGQSITNSAEVIAAEVIFDNRLPVPLIWIEHNEWGARGTEAEPHTFDLVVFSSYGIEISRGYGGVDRKRIGRPSWKPLDREAVESIIGGEV